MRMLIRCAVIIIICFTNSVLSGESDRCPDSDQYYDPITDLCHPCYDCQSGRNDNVYCRNKCLGVVDLRRCDETHYYDKVTDRCHPCEECQPPRPPIQSCLLQCPVVTQASVEPGSSVTPLTPESSLSAEILVTIIIVSVLAFVIIVVLVILCVLYFAGCLRRRKDAPNRHIVTYNHHNENGTEGVSLMSPSTTTAVPVSSTAVLRSLPATLNNDNNCHRPNNRHFASSDGELRILNEHPESTMVLDNVSRMNNPTIIHQSSSIMLQEESDGEAGAAGVTRRGSGRLNSSLLGNPVCHPEREECSAMAPTMVLAAAVSHVSLDPNKGGNDTFGEDRTSQSSQTSGRSFSETNYKGSR